jgi:hypothetical protein
MIKLLSTEDDMNKNILDEKLENFLNKLDSSKCINTPRRLPSWIKNSVLGAGMILIPIGFTGLNGCSAEEDEISQINNVYGSPSCYEYLHGTFINVTLDGSHVDAHFDIEESDNFKVEMIETGSYEVLVCDQIYDLLLHNVWGIKVYYEDYEKSISIDSLPETIDVELND